jgi:peptidyl-Lys metalloendopeptidase
MSRNLKVALFACLVLAVAVTSVPQAAAGPSRGPLLRTDLQVGKWWHEYSDTIRLDWSLTNEGDTSVQILRWQTPLDGIEGDILVVERDGETVPYAGRLIKRPAPEAEDYIEVKPGETLTASFDPSAAYDMSLKGQYTVRYRTLVDVTEVEPEDVGPVHGLARRSTTSEVESGEVVFWVEGRDAREGPLTLELNATAKGGKKPGGGGGNGQFTSCDNSQQSTLLTALSNATMISDKALGYLNGGTDTDLLYKTWFDYYGTVNNGWNTAKSHFNSISDAFHNKPITFDCSCRQRYYAYVYPTQPYKIYLCRVFWTAPNLGTDSKAGTLVHETSHFNVVAGTDDYVYGTAGAQSLAKTDPAKALDNADNHEYFAEHQK